MQIDEASVVCQGEDQIIVPFPSNQCGEAHDLNSGPVMSQYQPQPEYEESIGSTTVSQQTPYLLITIAVFPFFYLYIFY